MRNGLISSAIIGVLLLIFSCSAYQTVWLSLDLKTETVYTTSNIIVSYTYNCEDRKQYCSYRLYNSSDPSSILMADEGYMDSTGTLDFSDLGLGDGDYVLEFDIYSENGGDFFKLNFLEDRFEFTVDIP
ncbi:MAG: hypothetical protein PQJ61_01305 [Spirochaetales bacterium]|uniref:Uncharacterized protein n=1 Tax=Candidatus Thalassospirochaeta sargassi TaxID=3119039 RepID=A0AAJ1IFT2_9SPIO|nr:hypothetical protein [Spirochaetales bacterium]